MSDPSPKFDFIAGHHALDFANTLGGLRGGETREYIHNFSDLVRWASEAHLLAEDELEFLEATAAVHPLKATRSVEHALALRESLYALFSGLAAGEKAKEDALETLNTTLANARSATKLVQGKHGLLWHTDLSHENLNAISWKVALVAADLLTSERLIRVRECDGDVCSWLFIDSTKNHSRHWCTMQGCGNRAKVRRFRARNSQRK